jgi:hypothetical protein
MRSLTSWLLSALFFVALGGLSVWLFVHPGKEEADEKEHSSPTTAEATEKPESPEVFRDNNGSVVVRMDEETQNRVGLKLEPLAATSYQPELTAYGSVQENPSQTFTLRAPVTGTIFGNSSGTWPELGKKVARGTEVGALLPRLGPVERADMESKLATAWADVEDARASLVAMRASLESKRQLNKERKIVSDQVLQEAEAKVKGEEARLREPRRPSKRWNNRCRPHHGRQTPFR